MRVLLSICFSLYLLTGFGQAHQPMSVGEIYESLRKLNTLGSALYVAAHPDDENTRLITYLANERHVRTAYVSLTRGDGGQNLIGTEKGPLLGIIRTQELLSARRIDGGEQFFTRANDFGYSKTSEETFNIWDRNRVLGDLVWVIRKFRPDVIITRFPPAKYEYPTHGHHEASAVLAEEAFELAADPEAYPQQLEYVEPWQPKRLYWNTSTWFYRRTGEEFDSTGKLRIDVGGYNNMLGLSYGEIAGASRSQHKSQGFGAPETKGSIDEWLEFVKGTPAEKELFEGVELTWKRVEGGEAIGDLLKQAMEQFNPEEPTNILPILAAARNEMLLLPNDPLVKAKIQEIGQLMVGISGLFYEVVAQGAYGIPGDSVQLTLNLVNRTGADVSVRSIAWTQQTGAEDISRMLPANELVSVNKSIVLSDNLMYTHPYWLREPQQSIGMYAVQDPRLIGQPENDPSLVSQLLVDMDGAELTLQVPVQFKEVDRVKGEVIDPFVISPAVTLDLGEGVVLTSNKSKEVTVNLRAWSNHQTGTVELKTPPGWKTEPAVHPYQLAQAGAEANVTFTVSPMAGLAENGAMQAIARDGIKNYMRSKVVLDYDHIPTQTLFPKAEAQLVNLELAGNDKVIGYIMGAGDEVAEYLSQVGFAVLNINETNFSEVDMSQLDAILIGIRALNTEKWLVPKLPALHKYAEDGGNLIVQYQTTWGLLTDNFGPYPLEIGRGRVTEEDAEMKVLTKNEPVLNVPNELTPVDFDNWVQERGLYFAEEWDDHYRPVFKAHDTGEDDLQGMLLIADHGKGAFIYTGISFFRQLPAGVPGAYRLLTNLINYAPTGN